MMKHKIFSLIFMVALLLISSNAWTLAGSLTSTEQQQVGKVIGATTSDDKVIKRYIKFVGVARTLNHQVVEKLAIGIGEVPANGDDDSGEGKASWSFLSLSEAKQASKAMEKMYTLAHRKTNSDIAHKGLAFASPSGFSIDYQETLSGRLLTISAGENGGRRCDFTDMEYVRLVKGCIDNGIDWIENRPSKSPVPKMALHTGTAYVPLTGSKERAAIMNALRKTILAASKKQVIFKVYHLKVSEEYAYVGAQALDAKGKPIADLGAMYGSTQALLQKRNGIWKVLEWGIYSDSALEDECQRKYRKAPLAIYN